MSFSAVLMSMTLLTAVPVTPPDPELPLATIDSGVVVGRVAAERDIISFKGIPYAAPPVGPLRWRPPQPVAAWDTPRDAGSVGPICIQPPSGGDPGVGPCPTSEDCLTLNVWTPADRPETPLPVMVWIHGGGFNNGSGTPPLYDGSNLARHGAVVVTINYRLGRLGFFAHPSLTAQHPDEPQGNYALLDMIASLHWVQRNIDRFGGDPDNVMIFGESAGGVAVTRLMISPMAKGLFHRAAVQSGMGRERATYLSRPGPEGQLSAEDRGREFAQRVGLSPDATADQLRAIPADRFLTPPPPNLYAGDLPMIDGKFIDAQLDEAFAAGAQAHVPFLIGINSAEFWWMKHGQGGAYERAAEGFDEAERQALIAAYGAQEGYDADILSDVIFSEPARLLSRLHARTGQPTWLYRFDVVSDSVRGQYRGAPHASERQYVFQTLSTSGWATNQLDEAVAADMSGYWTAFARDGDPNGGGRIRWPEFGAEPDRLLEFTGAGPAPRAIPYPERLDGIAAYYRRVGR